MIISFGAKVRVLMEKNKLLKKLVPLIVNTGLVTWIYDVERNLHFRKHYLTHIPEFKKVEMLLADEMSRKTYCAVIKYRRTSRKKFLKGIIVYPQYFQNDIFGPAKDEVFVDGGAFTGDTIESYASNWGGVLEEGIRLGA